MLPPLSLVSCYISDLPNLPFICSHLVYISGPLQALLGLVLPVVAFLKTNEMQITFSLLTSLIQRRHCKERQAAAHIWHPDFSGWVLHGQRGGGEAVERGKVSWTAIPAARFHSLGYFEHCGCSTSVPFAAGWRWSFSVFSDAPGEISVPAV